MDNKLIKIDNISKYQKLDDKNVIIVLNDKYFSDYGMFLILEEHYLHKYEITKKYEIKQSIKKQLIDFKNNTAINYPLKIKLTFLKDSYKLQLLGD